MPIPTKSSNQFYGMQVPRNLRFPVTISLKNAVQNDNICGEVLQLECKWLSSEGQKAARKWYISLNM